MQEFPPFQADPTVWQRKCELVRNHLGEVVRLDGRIDELAIRNGRLMARVGDIWHIIGAMKPTAS